MASGHPLAAPAHERPSSPPSRNGASREPLQRYRLVVRLGEGRSTEVFLAMREVMPLVHEPVVLKRVRTKLPGGSPFVQRFSSEAALLCQLDHPHIVKML